LILANKNVNFSIRGIALSYLSVTENLLFLYAQYNTFTAELQYFLRNKLPQHLLNICTAVLEITKVI